MSIWNYVTEQPGHLYSTHVFIHTQNGMKFQWDWWWVAKLDCSPQSVTTIWIRLCFFLTMFIGHFAKLDRHVGYLSSWPITRLGFVVNIWTFFVPCTTFVLLVLRNSVYGNASVYLIFQMPQMTFGHTYAYIYTYKK